MIRTTFRRLAAVAVTAAVCLGARADEFYGTTTIDFNARGYSNYNVTIYADLIVGGDDYASAYASFAGLSGSSYSYIGEAGVTMYFTNVHKVGSQWVADEVNVLEFTNATGQYEWRYYYNYVMPNPSTVYGSAQCNGYTQVVRGYINGYGTPVNNPPVAAIAVPGYSSGATVYTNTTLSVSFSATDANSNLSGIRWNAYHATTGVHQNNGGSYVSRTGSSGTVTQSFTLSQAGTWYFWTEAIDTAGATGSTPAWTSGFRINVTTPPATTYCTPAYEPWYWNDNLQIRYNNNCYNYANNKRTDTFAQPGSGGGQPYVDITGWEIANGAVADGLEPTNAWSTSPQGKMKVALVIWPGWDFHWYRQDSNGMWSHKPGGTIARNYDESGFAISSPESADRGGYTEFVGYFFTPSTCVQGQGHANIQ